VIDQDNLNQFKIRLEAMRTELETAIRDESGQTDSVKLDDSLGRLSRMDALQSQAMARALQRRL
jgi:DnaK suppressor protein